MAAIRLSGTYAAFLVCWLLPAETYANDVATEQGTGGGVRYEVALGFNSWSALGELQPVASGEFDEVGYVFSGAVHWPVRRSGDNELLLGFDAGLFPNESSIAFVSDNLLARGLFLVPSLKWRPGTTKRLSLDAGIGYYLVDIAEVVSEYSFYIETEVWQEDGIGGFVGGTWNLGAATEDRGAMLSFKIHYFDFGPVRDEDPFLRTTLGSDAGKLSGPVYQLQFGYRWD